MSHERISGFLSSRYTNFLIIIIIIIIDGESREGIKGICVPCVLPPWHVRRVQIADWYTYIFLWTVPVIDID